MKNSYGQLTTGEAIIAKKGWEIIPEGEDIPQIHMEYREDYSDNTGQWCWERRCHSTMTPFNARVWGGVRAFARKN